MADRDPPDGPERRRRFDIIWHAHYAAVVAYGLRRAPDHARDLAADVFLVAWRRLDQIPDDALPWLLGVARNKLANHRRGDRRRAALLERLRAEPAAHAGDPADRLTGPEPLAAALASLAPIDREVLTLAAWEGLSAGRMAVVLGCSTGAAAVRLHRARARLRRAHAAGVERSSPRANPTKEAT